MDLLERNNKSYRIINIEFFNSNNDIAAGSGLQGRIVERLRGATLPENYQLRRHFPHLDRMMVRFSV